jgi:ELWxxDGT repeat protein
MKTSFWRRWCQSFRHAKLSSRISRAKARRQPLGLEALEDRVTPSLTPQMVRDINTNSLSADPAQLVAIGSTAFFIAYDGVHGGLWKSDGTEAGTVLVSSLGGSNLTNVNGTLFLVEDDGTHGRELWKSDGTAAGTTLVKDINFGGADSYPGNLTNVNGTLFFTADDGVHGRELWRSDGTAAGTAMIKDINPGTNGSNLGLPTNLNGTLFFTADDGLHGNELWKSDGTAAGTAMVKDINPGSNGSWPQGRPTNVNGTLFFSANDGQHGFELWKSAGTTAGTTLVKDIYRGSSGSYPAYLICVNRVLYFSANDGTHGREEWTSDGTATGTVPGSPVSLPPSNSTNVNGTLFYAVDDGTTGVELWKSAGTAAGATLVKDIYPGSSYQYDPYSGGWPLVPNSSNPSYLTNVNGTLFFTADDGVHGRELWKSDGTAAGTTLIKDINTNTLSANPGGMTAIGSTVYFAAGDAVNGWELWKSDGTAAGTVPLTGISGFSNPMALNGTLFFTTAVGVNGFLWKSDGTAAGTVVVDGFPGSVGNLTNVNGTLFFTADDGTSGTELWKSDGTAAGTTLVKDLYPGTHRVYDYYGNFSYVPNSSYPGFLTNFNGTLYFSADDGMHGQELWKSDGTATGTTLVNDINPGAGGSSPFRLTNVNGTLFFGANDGVHGDELWRCDGTAAGTVQVKDINPGSAGSSARYLTNVNGTLFFTADDGMHGRELWKSDGTAAGTTLVKDLFPGGHTDYYGNYYHNNSNPWNLTNVNGALFFSADDGTHGEELWKSDGTAAGTALVKDFVPGSAGSSPFWLTNVNGTLFLWTIDGKGASTIWQSDGTAAGTTAITNMPSTGLTNVNGTLFFSADDGIHGWELWKLVDPAAQGTSLAVKGFPATITAGVAGGFTITSQHADGSTNSGYRGTVHVASSDPRATLPGDYTFTAADQGVHTFSATLKTEGSQSIIINDTATSGAAATQLSSTVTPAAASRFTVGGFPSPVMAGVAGSFSVTAWDAYGNQATSYTGTVHFTSGDPRNSLPANYTFTASDAGVHTFSATLRTAGTQSIGVTDTGNSLLAGAQSGIVVTPNMVTHFNVALFPSSQRAGVTGTFRVIARDAYNNAVPSYTGTVHFSTSDPAKGVRLPANYTFISADNGIHTFHATLFTAGTQSLTVTDTLTSSITGAQTGIVITPAALHHFRVYGFPNPTVAGVPHTVWVQAKDLYGNTVTGYTGSIALSSSDPQAVLPGPYTFTAADAGTHAFSVTLNTVGKQSLTVKDQTDPTKTGTQATITVNPAGTARFLGGSPAGGGTVGSTRPAPRLAGAPLRKATSVDRGESGYAPRRRATDVLFAALSLASN